MDYMDKKREAALASYRVLDLTDEKGFVCGKILADLGADVIKIMKLGVNPTRSREVFPSNTAHPDASLYWLSYNVNKLGMTLDLESEEDRHIFQELVKTAHFVVESFDPEYLTNLGLGYKLLKKINPALVMVSITPFGQEGPYRRYKGSDLVCWAMGGALYPTGEEDRPPVQVSLPQAYSVAGANAAVGALIAHYYRGRTGRGQHVDVSVQACIPWVAQCAPDYWPCLKKNLRRAGHSFTIPSEVCPQGLRRRIVWPCKDGYICTYLMAGGPAKQMNAALADWMKEDGIVVNEIYTYSWDYFSLRRAPQEFIDRIEACLQGFFSRHTRSELFEEGQKRGIIIYPVCRINEILENPQLHERHFWIQIPGTRQDTRITYPGPWAKMSRTPCKIERPAPRDGEHTHEIINELSCSPKKVAEEYLNRNEPVVQPFQGILVIDFSWAAAAPIVTKFLAEHGATVIKIESPQPEYMDIVRTVPPYVNDKPDRENSGLFLRVSTNKLGTTINMSHPKGRELVRKLIGKADILVENFRGRVLEKWGLSYPEIREINPDIIALSSTNLGQTGPYNWMGGLGILLTGYAGFHCLTGWKDRDPTPLLGAYTDYVSPLLATAALIAALDYRRRTGMGQYIDVSQLECALQFLAPAVLDYSLNNREWERMGNRSFSACPHGVFRCKGDDRWCVIAVRNEEEWKKFKYALGNPPWANEKKFASFAKRKQNEGILEKLIEEYTIHYTDREIFHLLQSHRVPAGMTQNSRDLFEDPQLKFREFYKQLDHPKVGRHVVLKEPFILSESPSALDRAAPCLGQHNELVFKEIMGLSDDEYRQLKSVGVFGEQIPESGC